MREMETMKQRQVELRRKQAVEASFALARGDFDGILSNSFRGHQGGIEAATNSIYGLRTEYYNRFAMSVSCFFFVLLGSPFAILMAKKQFLTCFLFCFLPILTVYYPIAMMTQNMAKSGQIDPIWSAWLANLALLIAGGYYIHRVLKN